MKQQSTPSMLRLAGVGLTVVGTVVISLAAGIGLNAWLHWSWAVPVMLVFGFAAGMVSMFRQLVR